MKEARPFVAVLLVFAIVVNTIAVAAAQSRVMATPFGLLSSLDRWAWLCRAAEDGSGPDTEQPGDSHVRHFCCIVRAHIDVPLPVIAVLPTRAGTGIVLKHHPANYVLPVATAPPRNQEARGPPATV